MTTPCQVPTQPTCDHLTTYLPDIQYLALLKLAITLERASQLPKVPGDWLASNSPSQDVKKLPCNTAIAVHGHQRMFFAYIYDNGRAAGNEGLGGEEIDVATKDIMN